MWIKLMGVEKLRNGVDQDFYAKICKINLPNLVNTIKKDKILERTIVVKYRNNNETWKVPSQKLYRIIKAYGTID